MMSVYIEISQIVSFSSEMCKIEEDKKVVLVHLACSDALAWLHELVKYTLKGKKP